MKKYAFYLPVCFLLIIVSCSKKKGSVTDAVIPPAVQVPSISGAIRIMTYNIHHCNPPSKGTEIDLASVANVILRENPEIVALQEVDNNTTRSGAGNQAQQIAAKLGMSYFFAKAINYQGGEYGVAILSKYALSETIINTLPAEQGSTAEVRILATAKVSLPNGTFIRFGSTHFDAQSSSANRDLEAAEINRIATSETLPFIIAGDFNAVPDSDTIQLLDQKFTRTCQQCDPTIPAVFPTKSIDHIAFTPAAKFKVITHKVVPDPYPSDHRAVVATLEYQ